MKKMLTALWLPVALSVAIAAVGAPKQKQDSSMQGSSPSSSQITLTGCLQTGTEPNTYVLTNATTSSAKSKHGGKTGSNQAPSEMARAESSYILVPESGMDLSKHVGHRVRVTGTIEGQGMTSSSSTGQEQAAAGAQMSQTNMARFDVKSIRHVSNTCQ